MPTELRDANAKGEASIGNASDKESIRKFENIDNKERELKEREIALKAREDANEAREDEREKKRVALDEREREIINEEESIKQNKIDFQKQEKEAKQEWLKQEAELNKERDALADERRKMEKRERRLDYREQDLNEWENHLDEQVENRVSQEKERFESRAKALEARLKRARLDRDNLDNKLQRHEEADRMLGQRPVHEVIQENEILKSENEKLVSELAERPNIEAAERLANLEQEKDRWQAERRELHQREQKLKHLLDSYKYDASEKEIQRDRIQALKAQREVLHKAYNQQTELFQEAYNQIKSDYDKLLSHSNAKVSFPECRKMDQDKHLWSPAVTSKNIELKSFIHYLQNRIASESKLYYEPEDLRSFIGGLAMSQLILLQGISGTGKTSLPIAFAQAVGTKADVVEVQAGWRDPQDLVGHYNAFEKRFHEQEFLKALYRSQTTKWKDTVRIIVLDEMNLSHPEYYFSGLLSALERTDARLEIMPYSVEQAPRLLRDDGTLPIPPNVWFVGTANHDETTMDFADKTYDRAHVIALPSQPRKFNAVTPSPRCPSFDSLRRAFDQAITSNNQAANDVIDFFDEFVRKPLEEHFKIGWGSRLEKQIRQYVPVVVAAGGTIGEAADHILRMRILRKLDKRHDNPFDGLKKLQSEIKLHWSALLDERSEPKRSIEFLDQCMTGNSEDIG